VTTVTTVTTDDPGRAASPLLAVAGLTHAFGGVQAVDAVSLAVRRGEIYGLIGPNGAGKTTFINLVTGLLRPSAGSIHFAGVDVTRAPTHRIAAHGLVRTYQHIRVFPALTALENVLVGQHARRHAPLWRRLVLSPSAGREEARARERARALLEELGLGAGADTPAAALSYGDRRRLEIARALAGEPLLLLLDEPAAGMSHAETERLIDLLGRLPARGQSLLLVEHNMRVVMGVCHRIGVLNFGRLIAEGTPAAMRDNPAVVEAYLGREPDAGSDGGRG
jgi:ABC-type branched-subunit amino acid transport system ATPase component